MYQLDNPKDKIGGRSGANAIVYSKHTGTEARKGLAWPKAWQDNLYVNMP